MFRNFNLVDSSVVGSLAYLGISTLLILMCGKFFIFRNFNLVNASVVGSLAYLGISTFLMLPSWQVFHI